MSTDPDTKFNLDNSMQTEYFRLTEVFIRKFGANTILFMQVGAFFEMYATKNHEGVLSKSRIEDVASICGGLTITDKKQMYGKDLVVMAGFRDYNVERYIQSAVDANFTVVVYTQKDTDKGRMTRELTGVYSPGTFLPSDADNTTKMTNNVLCLWLDLYSPKMLNKGIPNKQHIICGAAVVNIFTGKSSMFEYETQMEMIPATFDDLERFVCTHAPSETIFVTPFRDDADSKKVLQYIGVASRTIHILHQYTTETDTDVQELLDRCRQQKYIRHVLSYFFREDTYDICEEFRNYVVGTQAYCYLLHFIQERNPNLVRKIALPQFDNQTTNMVLANHTLRQLNIINDGNSAADADMSGSNLRSVSSFLNKCGSAVGRRRFLNQIVHPTFDPVWLNSEYDAIAKLLEYPDLIDQFRKIVREVADLEKIGRQLVSRKLNPDSISRLYKSCLAIQQIHTCVINSNPELCEYFVREDKVDNSPKYPGSEKDSNKLVESWVTSILEFISLNLIVEKCEGCGSTTSFDENIVRPGVSNDLDELLKRMDENELLFQEIRKTFNTLMSKIDVTKSNSIEYVKVHETEKTGSFLQLTKKRSATLKKHLGETLKKDPYSKIVFSLGKSNIPVSVSDIQTVSAGTTNDTISFNLLDRIVREKITIRDTINSTISKAYAGFLDRLELQCLAIIENLTNFIAKVDVLQSKAYLAKTYGYCRPIIDESLPDESLPDESLPDGSAKGLASSQSLPSSGSAKGLASSQSSSSSSGSAKGLASSDSAKGLPSSQSLASSSSSQSLPSSSSSVSAKGLPSSSSSVSAKGLPSSQSLSSSSSSQFSSSVSAKGLASSDSAKGLASSSSSQSSSGSAKGLASSSSSVSAKGLASYVSAKGLRHVLIEHIQTQELYVANDITLGKYGDSQEDDVSKSKSEYMGMLLYGTNAVGKTSLIRALGVAVIMAQSGMYVPCSEFTYRPYRAIFTRILGNDNLFKNLSMFAVEMSELRVILNSADEYSLVLGDELCSGTETESALSIFVSGLTELHQKCATFLFATHFHEIMRFDEIKALTRIAIRHMAVHYDREHDCLVYDRVLREGAGNRLYGLEVAKSLHLPDKFIERAYQIRNKYFPDMRGALSSSSTKYNSSKLRGVCEMCKEDLAEEMHHLQEQHLADENGRIGTIHKNHPANLMSLCEKCHHKIHSLSDNPLAKTKPKVIRKKTTKGSILVETFGSDVEIK